MSRVRSATVVSGLIDHNKPYVKGEYVRLASVEGRWADHDKQTLCDGGVMRPAELKGRVCHPD